ncbi:MAG: hypothetical protein ACUVQM_00900 [Candidatus Hadarchaeaceae archaeon]
MMKVIGERITLPKFREDCLLTRGIDVRDLVGIRREALLYVQPCTSERGKLMADIELNREPDSRFLDPGKLCSLLRVHRHRFADLRCSETLGVAKLRWGGRDISIFMNGKIKIQQAMDREEILRVANSISRLIWGAAVCSVCGETVMNCASEKCGKCRLSGETAVEVSGIIGSEMLRQGYAILDDLERQEPQDHESRLQRARFLALHFAMATPRKEDAVLGLLLLARADQVASKLKGR